MPDNEKQNERIRGSSREIDSTARELRHRDTPAEQILWQSLRNRKLDGIRFRRQHPIGRFILDFYCPALKLVIEVDGGIHLGQRGRDAERDAVLSAAGYRVLRFSNQEVLTELEAVLERIRNIAGLI